MGERDSDIAIVHGHFFSRGGAERVAAELARTFEAPLYYGFGEEEYEPEKVECFSLFNDRPFANTIKNYNLLRNTYYLRKFQCVPELHDFDVVIQSGNEPGWYLPPEDQVVVKYTHSPPRDAYDNFPTQAPQRGRLYAFTSFITQLLYQRNLPYPDLYVANSEIIARRLDRYWDKKGDEVMTVYPPVDVESLGQDHAKNTPIDGDYYLALDRLVERKHIGDVVEAFEAKTDAKLVVAGGGPRADDLREQATDMDNVRFMGYVPEATKRTLLAGADALVYAAENEDFGIVPIESLASGTPVIGPREGFTQHQIQDGVRGILYDRGPNAIGEAIDRFEAEGVTSSPGNLEDYAEQFSSARFQEEMRDAVEIAERRAHVLSKARGLGEPTAEPSEHVPPVGRSEAE